MQYMLPDKVERCRTLLWELTIPPFLSAEIEKKVIMTTELACWENICQVNFFIIYYGLGILKIIFDEDNHELNMDEFFKWQIIIRTQFFMCKGSPSGSVYTYQ